ncbi:MAG: radical SAM protein [Elusimicrobia bacterium]|nr:radical SAM protein [Elusimicrobiota bacterium]
MTHPRGAAVGDYRAPLFVAWQLTNRCRGRCLACCEESGPGKGIRQGGSWQAELTKQEALRVSRDIAASGVSYVAFGGGEPMEVPHFWDILSILSKGGVRIKIETNGGTIGRSQAKRLSALGVSSIQISLDGPTAREHEALRPGSSFNKAVRAVRCLAEEGLGPEVVFIPMKRNVGQAVKVYRLAASLGARVLATGPLMRLGRAGAAWKELAPSAGRWRTAVRALKAEAARAKAGPKLSIYPWGIQREIETRLEHPQAMVLVVPDGKVKLLNALPFAPGDLRRHSLAQAWTRCLGAWRDPKVRAFCRKAVKDPGLLAHANECWPA